jgi:hypothetical protein
MHRSITITNVLEEISLNFGPSEISFGENVLSMNEKE